MDSPWKPLKCFSIRLICEHHFNAQLASGPFQKIHAFYILPSYGHSERRSLTSIGNTTEQFNLWSSIFFIDFTHNFQTPQNKFLLISHQKGDVFILAISVAEKQVHFTQASYNHGFLQLLEVLQWFLLWFIRSIFSIDNNKNTWMEGCHFLNITVNEYFTER